MLSAYIFHIASFDRFCQLYRSWSKRFDERLHDSHLIIDLIVYVDDFINSEWKFELKEI